MKMILYINKSVKLFTLKKWLVLSYEQTHFIFFKFFLLKMFVVKFVQICHLTLIILCV